MYVNIVKKKTLIDIHGSLSPVVWRTAQTVAPVSTRDSSRPISSSLVKQLNLRTFPPGNLQSCGAALQVDHKYLTEID